MNIGNGLLIGFIQHLENENILTEKDLNEINNDYSIFFKYSDEFKDYLSDTVSFSSAQMKSKSISELLDMEIKNGKLVDPEAENAEGDNFNFEADENIFGSSEGETTLPEGETALPAGKTAAPEGETVLPEGEAVLPEVENVMPEGEVTAPSEGGDTIEGEAGAIIPDMMTGENKEEESDFDVVDLLNSLFEQDEVKEVIDTDKDGELNEDEIHAFLNEINKNDNDIDNLSFEDIFGAIDEIKDGTFSFEDEVQELENVEEPEESADEGAFGGNSTSAINPGSSISSGYGNYGNGGSYNKSVEPQEKTLDNMTKDELNTELSTAESDLSVKKEKLSAVLDGSDPELQRLKDAENEAYEAYQKELENVDKDMAEQVDELKTSIDDKESEIDAKEQEISDQKTVVSDCETEYNNAVATTKTLETSLAALQSADTSNMDSEKQAELNTKISELESKITQAKEKETETKRAWDSAKDKLTELEDKKNDLEDELNELNEQMTTLEEEIAEKYPEIKEYMDAYKDAKEEYTDTKQEAITTAQDDIDKSQEYVNEVKTAINNYDNREIEKEYTLSSDFQKAVDWARQYDDLNQEQMREIFAKLGYQFDYDAWCADFVRMALGEAIGDENLPDWYRNCSNKAYCPTIQEYGEGHQISAEEAQAGDIVLYDWNGDGYADHVGLFVDNGNGSTTITAIEGNTSGAGGGSCVEEKERNRGDIIGIYSMH